MSILPLSPRHAADMRRIRHAALLEAPTAFGTDPDWELSKTTAYYHRFLLRIQARRREEILGLWFEDALIGMNGLGQRVQDRHTYALIYSMFILPEFRNQGYGTDLLHHSCHHAAKAWKVDACRITVETGNQAARRLYESRGFEYLFREKKAFSLQGIDYDVDHLEKRLSPHSSFVTQSTPEA